MTFVSYPDCSATSASGRYRLEARSPDNGTILRRDGTKPSADEFEFKYREFQRDFRYQLLDRNGLLVWERWQRAKENSPAEVVVSDDGWSILRLHGSSPSLVVVALDGRDVLQVEIVGPFLSESDSEESATPVQVWRAEHAQDTTAGVYWTVHGWRYFLRCGDHEFFVWRTAWGARLIIDLTQARVLDPDDDGRIETLLCDEESRGAEALLANLAARIEEVRALAPNGRVADGGDPALLATVGNSIAAIHLAGVHRLKSCIPYLRRLETIDWIASWGSSIALGFLSWDTESQYLRPIAQHSLRLLDEEPEGCSAYYFPRLFTGRKRLLPNQRPLQHRNRGAGGLRHWMSASQVLRQLGSPDHIRTEVFQVGKRHRWKEYWDYDFREDGRWVTLRITWKPLFFFCTALPRWEVIRPAPWLNSDEREKELLDY